nr:sigma-54 dependent transcriptional regulator [Acetobacter conturbans]
MIVGSLSGELGKAAKIVLARGVSIDHAETGKEAVSKICLNGDYRFIFCSVIEDISSLIKRMESERIAVPVVACGPEDPEMAAHAISCGAEDYIPLPPDPDIIAGFLENASQEKSTFLTIDPVMKTFMADVEKIAASDASVLITGESGTGKEVLSKYIHVKSKRASAPFVALNCAALPETLVESELFGHERGAFSGAATRRVGRFEAANHGTLLLDEISEMDIRLQAKLLRAIQEREIDRLGGNSPVPVDVRIIATSNRNLPSEVETGGFRQDLYFRLNVISLSIPPLRQRQNDIPLLAKYFSDHYSKVNGLKPRRLSSEAVEKLQKYNWPGNVRELENAIHRAVIISSHEEIDENCFIFADSNIPSVEPDSPTCSWVGHRMDEMEQAFIIDTLVHTDGNRTHAASMLGISIRALRNKLKEYAEHGVSVPPPNSGMAGLS